MTTILLLKISRLCGGGVGAARCALLLLLLRKFLRLRSSMAAEAIMSFWLWSFQFECTPPHFHHDSLLIFNRSILVMPHTSRWKFYIWKHKFLWLRSRMAAEAIKSLWLWSFQSECTRPLTPNPTHNTHMMTLFLNKLGNHFLAVVLWIKIKIDPHLKWLQPITLWSLL